MSDSTSDYLAWICPSCGRRVPRRVAECRCGLQQTDVPPSANIVDHATVHPQKGRYGLVFFGSIAVLAVALAMIPRPKGPSEVDPGMTPVGAQRPTPTPGSPAEVAAPSEPASSAPTSSLPGLPADVPVTVLPEAPAAAPAPAPGVIMPLDEIDTRVFPAVVTIEAGGSRGTGFHIRPEYVLTNAHVVEGQSAVSLRYSDESKRSGRVMGISSGTDLAVVQVYNPNPEQRTLTLGSSRHVRPGQEVIAVGSALGVLHNTVTRGIVSAIRPVGSVTLIQTDAAINPGNSGGPLLDRSGLVIGVNTIGVSKYVAEGLGFAVAIDHAAQLLSGQGSVTAPSPLAALNREMGGPSEGQQLRQHGEQAYKRVLEAASRNADRLDEYWQRYAKACVVSSVRAGDREWFAVYEPNGIRITAHSRYNCEAWLENVTENSDRIKADVDAATELARRSGVYPGFMRDVRRRVRMDWTGWDR
jgi:putative serine protease PepD